MPLAKSALELFFLAAAEAKAFFASPAVASFSEVLISFWAAAEERAEASESALPAEEEREERFFWHYYHCFYCYLHHCCSFCLRRRRWQEPQRHFCFLH